MHVNMHYISRNTHCSAFHNSPMHTTNDIVGKMTPVHLQDHSSQLHKTMHTAGRVGHWESSATDRGRGQQGQFALGPQCKGAPKQCGLVEIRSGLSVTFQSSFFKGFIFLYFQLLLCFMFYAADANFRLMHHHLTWLLCSPLARAPYVVLFDLKPLIEDSNL